MEMLHLLGYCSSNVLQMFHNSARICSLVSPRVSLCYIAQLVLTFGRSEFPTSAEPCPVFMSPWLRTRLLLGWVARFGAGR